MIRRFLHPFEFRTSSFGFRISDFLPKFVLIIRRASSSRKDYGTDRECTAAATDASDKLAHRKRIRQSKIEPITCTLRSQSPQSGSVAQFGERLVCNQEVAGSIPVVST